MGSFLLKVRKCKECLAFLHRHFTFIFKLIFGLYLGFGAMSCSAQKLLPTMAPNNVLGTTNLKFLQGRPVFWHIEPSLWLLVIYVKVNNEVLGHAQPYIISSSSSSSSNSTTKYNPSLGMLKNFQMWVWGLGV